MYLGLLALALAADEPPCLVEAIASLRVDPNGFVVYRQLDDRDAFGFWIDCDEPDYDVSSAVHESVHLLSGAGSDLEHYGLYLVGGDRLRVPLGPTPARSLVVDRLREDERDSYVETYLRGRSGEQGFETLLDELNAYTHGLTTETALAERRRRPDDRSTGARDGVAHFQLYTLLYLQALQAEHPGAFERLAETHGEMVGAVWKQAEVALAASSAHAGLGIDDHWYLARTYAPELLEVLDAFVGARVWSSSIQAEVRRRPPARPQPAEARGGHSEERWRHQERFRASVQLGAHTWQYEERRPSGEVVLLIDGERSPARSWADVEKLGLPDEVLQALREARPPDP